MPGTGPRISVVIPHLDDEAGLARLLAALTAQEGAPEHEIIVADNGSRRPPEALCAGTARLVHEDRPGPGPARNAGAAAARGEILAFTDSDCIPAPDWLAAIATAFADDPRLAVAAGDVRIALRDPSRPDMIEACESVFGYRQALYVARDRYAATCNMAVRAAVFADVGPFAGLDTAEDMDWGRRAHRRGHHIGYVAQIRVETPARASFAELARKWDRHVAHAWAERPGRALWLARAALVAASPLAETGTILRSPRIAGPRARILAWLGTARIRLHRARRMTELALGRNPARLARRWRGG